MLCGVSHHCGLNESDQNIPSVLIPGYGVSQHSIYLDGEERFQHTRSKDNNQIGYFVINIVSKSSSCSSLMVEFYKSRNQIGIVAGDYSSEFVKNSWKRDIA